MKPEALKLLKDVVRDLEDIANAESYCNPQETARQALKDIRAAIFMETPQPSMKFNIYDFADDDNGSRPIMGCVHHQDGFKVACDCHVLVAVKTDYSEDLEGKSIDKHGEVCDRKYPNWKALFNDHQKEAEGYKIDFAMLAGWMKEYAAEKKMHGKWGARKAYVKVGDAFFPLPNLAGFAKFMKAVGCDTLHVEDGRHAAACFAEDGSMGLIMPALYYCNEVTLAELWEKKDDRVIMWEAA